jgi:hypothetical protein
VSRNNSSSKLAKPLLFLDIDGVFSLWGFDFDDRPEGVFLAVEGMTHYIAAGNDLRLAELAAAYELVWCSGWEERANEHLLGALALPGELPFLTFGGDARFGSAHWKLGPIDAYVDPRRPIAWIDDSLDDACREWASRRPGPTLLVQTQPAVGMTDDHVRELLAWAASPTGGDAAPQESS